MPVACQEWWHLSKCNRHGISFCRYAHNVISITYELTTFLVPIADAAAAFVAEPRSIPDYDDYKSGGDYDVIDYVNGDFDRVTANSQETPRKQNPSRKVQLIRYDL